MFSIKNTIEFKEKIITLQSLPPGSVFQKDDKIYVKLNERNPGNTFCDCFSIQEDRIFFDSLAKSEKVLAIDANCSISIEKKTKSVPTAAIPKSKKKKEVSVVSVPKSEKTFKLGPNQKKYIAALRSGKYIQGRGKLANVLSDNQVSYCCLGVACEVAQIISENRGVTGDIYRVYGKLRDGGTLPIEAVEKYRFHDSAGTFLEEEFKKMARDGLFVYDNLVAANDSGKVTFNQIADAMEQYPQVFFKEPK
jgi:hypothetical protein